MTTSGASEWNQPSVSPRKPATIDQRALTKCLESSECIKWEREKWERKARTSRVTSRQTLSPSLSLYLNTCSYRVCSSLKNTLPFNSILYVVNYNLILFKGIIEFSSLTVSELRKLLPNILISLKKPINISAPMSNWKCPYFYDLKYGMAHAWT